MQENRRWERRTSWGEDLPWPTARGSSVFVAMHHAALQRLSSDPGATGDAAHMLRSAEKFLVESLSPYEMTHRGFRDAIASLRHLNETLEQEIQRIARAVHDEAGQLLVAVHLAFADVARDLPSPLQDRLQPVTGLLNQVEEQLRRLRMNSGQRFSTIWGWRPRSASWPIAFPREQDWRFPCNNRASGPAS